MIGIADLVDDEQLVFALLKRDLPNGTEVAAELDVDSIDNLPLVTFHVYGGDQNGNGPRLWRSSLTVNVFSDGANAAWAMCVATYRAIHAWENPNGSIVAGKPELGYVSTVADLSKFSRVATVAMQGKQITQYTGSFELTIRN